MGNYPQRACITGETGNGRDDQLLDVIGQEKARKKAPWDSKTEIRRKQTGNNFREGLEVHIPVFPPPSNLAGGT